LEINWLAMYNRGYEAWTAWRTYDMPGFNLPAVSLLPVPTRLTYPISEQNLNQANYAAASTAIGGDEQTTKFSGIKTKKIVLVYIIKGSRGQPFVINT
jgi:ribose/xylose/arabinose/galactoside ABC-type transport system permease subunit